MVKLQIACVVSVMILHGLHACPSEAQGFGSTSRVVQMTSLHRTDHVRFKGTVRELVRDTATFRRRWIETYGAGGTPRIDFSQSAVLLIAIGSRSTGGYEVHVRELRTTGNELHVFLDLIEPGPGCPVPAEVQSPATMVQVMLRVRASSPPKLVFHDRKLALPCSAH